MNYDSESLFLRFLYHTVLGRLLLKFFCSKGVSKLCQCFFDSPLSKCMINSFVKSNNINLDEYCCDNINCFNDFFSRKIKPGIRVVDNSPNNLISPCDGLLSVHQIKDGMVLPVKQSMYTISTLLGENTKLANKYKDGICLVYRLCINNYHRYCYVDSGKKTDNIYISGMLHTVRPIALETYPVFVENCREYTSIDSENFGLITQVEVGAILIGKIKNHHSVATVKKGEEKGTFLYGGSTIIVLLEKDKAIVNEDIAKIIDTNIEVPVKYGECIGKVKETVSLS